MLIFLSGADTFRSREKLNAIKNKYLEKNSSGSGLSVLDFNEKVESAKLHDAFSSSNLFSPKKMIMLLGTLEYAPIDQQKIIMDKLKSSTDEYVTGSDTVVLFYEKTDPKKNLSLYKFLAANAKKQEFPLLNPADLRKWIKERIAQINPAISLHALATEELILSTGNDLFALSNDLEKIAAFCQDKKTIEKQDVILLVKSKIDSTIFETIEALCSKNKKRALKLLHEQIEKGEDPFYILSMYFYQLRNMLRIGDLFWQGQKNHFAIAKQLGLHPFVAQKSLPLLNGTDAQSLQAMFQNLVTIDQKAKTGKTDLVLALDAFIASL